MKDYLELNKAAYEQTAAEFKQKITLRQSSDDSFVKNLVKILPYSSANLLELGPGSGYIAKLFGQYHYKVTAIEFSPAMAAVAQQTAPNAHMIIDEFLNHDFKNQRFDVILGIAFIHLFPKLEVEVVIQKIKSLLTPKGVVILSTTIHKEDTEGYLHKVNFTEGPQRFRKQYTEDSFKELFISSGFHIDKYFINKDSEGNKDKRWMTIIASLA